MNITRGQRIKLGDLGLLDQPFSVTLELVTGGLSVDVACFGLDAQKKLSNDAYMTFFNQPETPCRAVKVTGERFNFDLSRLPASIDFLTITLAIDGAGEMSKLGACRAALSRNSETVASYAFDGSHFAAERAMMLLEFYRKDGVWRLCAVGQGFNGGLDALVTHFGGVVAKEPAEKLVTESTPLPPPTPAAPKVNLSKITLQKRGDKISLEKRSSSAGHGRIVCNLNWSRGVAPAPAQKKGLFGRRSAGATQLGIDLDLGCLYEMADGTKSAVQALGETFGDYERAPFINMAGDDRTGANEHGEFLYINGDHLKDLKRICIYAFIYEGVANWGEADGVVTLTVPGHPLIEVCLDNHVDGKNMCAIAMLENDRGELRISKLGEYFAGHVELDNRYGWGLRWQSGTKD